MTELKKMIAKKKKVLLITTKGCEACRIMDNIIQLALDNYDSQVDYEIKDKDNIDIEFLKEKHIDDFPTTILYQDNRIVFMFVGTKPAEVVRKYMTIHFD